MGSPIDFDSHDHLVVKHAGSRGGFKIRRVDRRDAVAAEALIELRRRYLAHTGIVRQPAAETENPHNLRAYEENQPDANDDRDLLPHGPTVPAALRKMREGSHTPS